MPELEKVIRGLEDRIADAEYIDDGYYAEYVAVELLQAALELLKTQVPLVINDELLLEHDGAVWLENKRDIGTVLSICKSEDDMWFRFFSKNEWENVAYLRKNYGITWRCWTARPTEEQRKAVKWDE